MWFYEQYNLTDITGMEYLNTSEVTTMSLLFASCSKLTELDLSHFDTHNVTGMSSLFSNCSSLTTIYAGDGWNTEKVTAYGSIFNGCSSNLRGSAGTAYNSSHKDDITYARIDGGVDEPGYLSHKNEAYAIFTADDNTLTFYCDGQRNVREKTETTYNLNTGTNLPEWNEISADVAHVVFNYSFGAARPTSTYKWFSDMTNLVDIGDMIDNYDNLYFNTSEVTNMSYMFYNCRSLTGVDLTHFDTQKVTDMSHMFDGCRNLTTLDLSNFNTSQVTDMTSMFYDCRQLTTINVRAGWNTENVMNATSAAMFEGCTSLVGGQGTTYDVNYIDMAYAHIDGGPSNPGYFSQKPAFLRGDVDGDTHVDINDVTKLIGVVLGNSTDYNAAAADCDVAGGSGNIDINDVTALLNFVLNGHW
jgi:surface protein